MKIIELFEMIIPADQASPRYGYWVTHTGGVIETAFENHTGAAIEPLRELGFAVKGDFDASLETQKLGWVAIRMEHHGDDRAELNITIYPNRMTLACTNGLLALLRRLEIIFDITGVQVDTSKAHGYTHAWMQPKDRKPLMRLAQWIKENSVRLSEPDINIWKNEIFETLDGSTARWRWVERKSIEWVAEFRIQSVTYTVSIFLEHSVEGRWELSFTAETPEREFGYSRSGTGNAWMVFSTVVQIARMFVQERSPNIIRIDSEDSKRLAVNRRIAQAIAHDNPYTVTVFGNNIYITKQSPDQ